MKDGIVFELKNVDFAYAGRIPALRGVSLKIPQGERAAVLGANGAGKSSLLKILDGLYYPDAGEVWAFGVRLTEEALQDERFAHAFRRRVGLVFQDSDVQLFSPTVWEEVAFGPLQMGLSGAEVERRVQRALSQMDITDLADRAPYSLSGGEKKKVAIASVISIQPQVLLMDEPTANLDPRSKWRLVDLILDYAEGGATIVVATHDLDVVDAVATMVYVLSEENQVVAHGTPREILQDEQLLVRTNLVHEHVHQHDGVRHKHRHLHVDSHEHGHHGVGTTEAQRHREGK